MSSVAPALWTTSLAPRFYLKAAGNFASDGTRTGFSHVFYPTLAETLASVALPTSGLVQLPNWNSSGATRNYVLLVGEQNAESDPAANVVLPLMVSFPPGGVEALEVIAAGTTRYVCFNLIGGGMRNIALSMPYGADGFDGPALTWRDRVVGGTPAVWPHCNRMNALACNMPRDVVEDFDEEEVPGSVKIRDTFTDWRKLAVECPDVRYAPLPPLVVQYSGVVNGITHDIVYRAPYANKYASNYYYVEDATVSTYTLLGAPRHDAHAVRLGVATEYQAMAEQMINHSNWTQRQHTTAVFNPMANQGAPYALGLVSKAARQRYVARMAGTIDQLMNVNVIGLDTSVPPPDAFDLGDVIPHHKALAEGISPFLGWRWYSVPITCATTETYLAPLAKELAGVKVPYDIDAGGGTILEYIYEYLLWSGDDVLVEHLWDGTTPHINLQDVYEPLWRFHDWAWMAGAARHWGDGARSDMLAAQYAGLVAFARLGEVFAPADLSTARARYLAAKAQLPLVARYEALTLHAQNFYKTVAPAVATQIIPGFGEAEPSGPMLDIDVRHLTNWSDWTMAGEKLHPIVYEGMERAYKGSAYNTLLAGFAAHRPGLFNNGMLRASFAENKVYAFARHGMYGTEASDTTNALTDIRWFTEVRGEPANQGLKLAHSYEEFSSTPFAWYQGVWQTAQPATYQSPGAVTPDLPTPAYAGLLERLSSKVAIGGWGRVGVTDAWIDNNAIHVVVQRSGTLLLQYDGFLPGWQANGISGYDATWSTYRWAVTGGVENTVALAGSGISVGLPDPTPDRANLLSYGSFEGLGQARSNIESGWVGIEARTITGATTNREAAVRVTGDGPPNERAMHLQANTDDRTTAGYVYQVAYVSDHAEQPEAPFPYKLNFRYKTSDPWMVLQAFLRAEDDTSCFKATEPHPPNVRLCPEASELPVESAVPV